MGLGLGFALAGLGQGLEQGIGSYLAQKRYENELALQRRAADDAHRTAVLTDVVNYGWNPNGASDDGSAPDAAPSSSAPGMVGSMLGRAANGPAANTPTISPGSVLGQQRNGLSGPGASATSSTPVTSALTGGRVNVPGIGSIDPTNSMFGIKRALAVADMQKALGEARHQQMVNDAGPAGIDGTPEHANYVADLEARKALATLPVTLRLKVLEGQISLNNALQVAGVQHTYRTGEIAQEGSIQRGLIGPRAQAQTQTAENTQLFKEGGEIFPSIVRPINSGVRSIFNEFVDAPSPTSLPTKPPITAAERAALISQGYRPDQIDAQYSVTVPASGSSW